MPGGTMSFRSAIEGAIKGAVFRSRRPGQSEVAVVRQAGGST